MSIAQERIERLDLFQGLAGGVLRRCADAAREADARTGELLISADGGSADAVFIERGIAAVYLHTPEGRPVLCDLLGAGRLAEPGSVLRPRPPRVEVRALMPTRSITIPGRILEELLLENAALGVTIYRSLLEIERRRLAQLAGSISAEPGTFARAEGCPLERQSKVMLSGVVRTGEIQAFCRQQGLCPGAGEEGCPMADRDPREVVRLWTEAP